MKNDILVIGGYGVAGQTICRELGRKAPGRVFAAGRNLERAERFCRTTAGSVLPLRLDIREPIGEHFFARFRAVVMCLDQENTDFLRACIRSGTHYADVTANNSFLSKAEGLHEDARANGAAVVLSVGLAPGLTNLLALEAVNRMDATATLDISVMLGLGDSHGDAAMEWTLQNVNKSFEVTENGGKVSVSAFTDGKLVDFGTGFGRKKAYRFNFPDQHTLPRTLRVPSVSTRLCFDSGAATMLLAGLKAVNMLSFLETKPVRRAAIRVAGLIRWGQDSYALKVDAWGKRTSAMFMWNAF
ncbi:saccharopine dehydrogenase NADP-binding domain-containing protein [Paenibacillus hemerocallicola]|uniref:saccharopine dehydrogenase NADP-binding domain-containing protein n=1 Tax=Paenibacillus hemerocallicola TaxID=1172614 RepID=UPI001FE38FFA|nr:saccharopine dehydrogenase NADP-binding domain-containing protein [Paenibacillus hemerocallicola]